MESFLIFISIFVFIFFIIMGVLLFKFAKNYQEKEELRKEEFASKNGFEHSDSFVSEVLTGFGILKWANERNLKNFFKKDNMLIFELLVSTGKSQVAYTVFQYKFKKSVPSFTLNKLNFLYNFAKVFGYQDIDFTHAPKFSKKYLLRGKQESQVKSFFNLEKLKFFENLEDFDNIEVNENTFTTYKYKIQLEDYNTFFDKNRKIIEVLEK